MKTILFVCMFTTCLFIGNISAAERPSENRELIENSIRIRQLEETRERQREDMLREMEKNRDAQEKDFQEYKEQVDRRSDNINYWLSALGIVLTVYGIGIPFLGVWYSKKQRDDFREQEEAVKEDLEGYKKSAQKSLDLFIAESKQKISDMEKTANASIANLKQKEKEGQDITQQLNGIYKKALDPNLSSEDKADLLSQTEEIKNEENADPFEKEMAKALEIYLSGNNEDTITSFESILKKYPERITMSRLAEIYYYLGYANHELNNLSKAKEFYDHVLEITPDDVHCLNNQGVVFDKLGEKDKALEYFQKVIAIDESFADAWFNLGYVADSQKQFDKAIEYYTKTLEIQPEHEETLCNLSIIYVNLDRKKEALKYLSKYIELASSLDKEMLFITAQLFGEFSHFEEALKCYKNIVNIDSNDVDSRLAIIEILIIMNEIEVAESKLNEYIAQFPQQLFETKLFGTLISIIKEKYPNTVNETADVLLKTVNYDISKVEWDFKELKIWLYSAYSDFLTPDQRQFITELIEKLEEWIESEQKKNPNPEHNE